MCLKSLQLLMSDSRHIGPELSRISGESRHLREGVILNYSSRIERQSVRGCRGENRDDRVIMDVSTSAGW